MVLLMYPAISVSGQALRLENKPAEPREVCFFSCYFAPTVYNSPVVINNLTIRITHSVTRHLSCSTPSFQLIKEILAGHSKGEAG